MEMVSKESPMDSFMELDIGRSSESFLRFLEAQKELFHSQIDQLQNIVATQCKLTGANPLSQEMVAFSFVYLAFGGQRHQCLNLERSPILSFTALVELLIWKSDASVRYAFGHCSSLRVVLMAGFAVIRNLGVSVFCLSAAGALSIKIGKRPRDLLNPKAIQYMQSVFSIKDTISKKETREISALCGVTVTQVRDFFAGQRSRVRRLVRLSREKAVGFEACETPLDESKGSPNGNKASPDGSTAPDRSNPVDGIIINSSIATPVSNPVPLNSADPRNATEGSSCSSQDENIPGIDDSDKHFLQNILNLMTKEKTFSGQAKLMEWVLQIHNSAVLQWFLSKGGVMILATWLSLAALEEQTTVILTIFKVLCHLPLHKALPAHMSAILQTVNRSQALKKPSSANCTTDIQKERIRMLRKETPKQATKLLTASGENSNKKLALSGSPSRILLLQTLVNALQSIWMTSKENDKFQTGTVPKSFQTSVARMAIRNWPGLFGWKNCVSGFGEKRKVLLVEHPGSKTAGRSVQVARAATTNQSRPMSADDIQKAKMRAIFMQSKYEKSKTSLVGNSPEKSGNGKPKTSSSETPQERTDNQKAHTVTQNGDVQISPSIQSVDNCGKPSLSSTSSNHKITSLSQCGDSPPMSDALELKQGEDAPVIALPSETSDALLETSKPSMVPQEPLWKKLKRDQVQWQTPPEMRMNDTWSVGAGEKSKEVEVQTARIRREKETVYGSIHDIPSNPKEPWDVEMDFDDTLTAEIPTEQPPDADGSEAASPRNAELVPAVASAPVSNGLEPDLELLAVLLKNPELVFALTSGQGNGFSSAETVALLDMLKRSNINLPGALGGLGEKVVEKPETTSLPSPTPPAEREMVSPFAFFKENSQYGCV
ncbi:hypothetical protein ACLOJK_017927 [Asimina triloba]